MEPDYYIEALHKRLQTATPPLYVKLRYAPPPRGIWDQITTTGQEFRLVLRRDADGESVPEVAGFRFNG
jgi:hypothetical protein